MQKRSVVLAASAVLLSSLWAAPALATVDLQITEIWPGGLAATESTSDWFELTNFGDMAATGLDGTLYYDDSHGDATRDDAMFGIDTIAPGESVIYLVSWEDDYNLSSQAIDAFEAMWAPYPAGSVQIGYVDGGRGLGGSGDAVNVFDGNTSGANVIDNESYALGGFVESYVSKGNGTWNEDLAQVGVLEAYEGNFGADNGVADPPIGSPGSVPEPTSAGLALLTIAGLLCRAARRR